MHGALVGKADHRMALDFFRDLLCRHFSDDEAERQLATALDWGRYADLFSYDRQADQIGGPEAALTAGPEESASDK
jgi:NitT/TauT family transport system ATP-binding protein